MEKKKKKTKKSLNVTSTSLFLTAVIVTKLILPENVFSGILLDSITTISLCYKIQLFFNLLKNATQCAPYCKSFVRLCSLNLEISYYAENH